MNRIIWLCKSFAIVLIAVSTASAGGKNLVRPDSEPIAVQPVTQDSPEPTLLSHLWKSYKTAIKSVRGTQPLPNTRYSTDPKNTASKSVVTKKGASSTKSTIKENPSSPKVHRFHRLKRLRRFKRNKGLRKRFKRMQRRHFIP